MDCVNARIQPNRYKAGEAYSGILIIPYTGGNGGYCSSRNPIYSTGVTGLTATLQPGNLAYGNGYLYRLEGTPSASSPSLASFEIDFLGQSCSAQVGANSLQQGEQTYWHGSMPANVGGANVLASLILRFPQEIICSLTMAFTYGLVIIILLQGQPIMGR